MWMELPPFPLRFYGMLCPILYSYRNPVMSLHSVCHDWQLCELFVRHSEIKSRLKSVNACCHSVQNILSSSLLNKNLKFKINRTIILPVVLYGCETW